MNYIDPSVSGKALERFFRKIERSGARLHCVIVYERGKPMLRFAAAPYRLDDKRELYSLSKSFTSTAVGVLYDRGLIHPEQPVLSIFPEYASRAEADPRWSRMLVKHALCMCTGHESCVFSQMAFGDDSVRAFFDSPLRYEPGEAFVYNTGATCLLAAMVRRLSGQTVPQLLAETVFQALAIDDFNWKQTLDGSCQGGTGLSLSCEDVVKLGLLYQNHGMWRGKRVLSAEWTELATSRQTPGVENGTPDWCSGYGFQFWRNHREGYRGDGAFGQACAVLPESGVVMAILAETGDMCGELNDAWAFLSEMHTPGPDCGVMPELCYKPLGVISAGATDTGWRELAPNPANIAALRLQAEGQTAALSLLTDAGVQRLFAVAGQWSEQTLALPEFMPSLYQQMPRRAPQAMRMSVCVRTEADEWVFDVALRNAPHAFQLRVSLTGGRLAVALQSPLDVFGGEKRLEEKRGANG